MLTLVNRGSRFLFDVLVLSLAYWLAYYLRFEFSPSVDVLKLLILTWPYVIVVKHLALLLFGVTRFAWRYVSLREVGVILLALLSASLVLLAVRLGLASVEGYTRFVRIPVGVLAMDFVLSFVGISGIRAVHRLVTEKLASANRRVRGVSMVRTLLIGAGDAGVMVYKEILTRPDLGIEPVGFLDDDRRKQGVVIHGLRVLGTTVDLKKIAEISQATQALITIANAPGTAVRSIVQACEEAGLTSKIIPGLFEIVGGRVNLSRIRPVAIEDLLGRQQVQLNLQALSSFIQRKAVLVTGAGGSIGSELCRLVSQFGPSRLILVERFENALYEIHSELSRRFPDVDIAPCVADISDWARMDGIFSSSRPDVVLHAAAHKHVPMMEWNPGEAIKNNVVGTKLMTELAAKHGVGHFVMISTDKAVNPTSVMGASKRVAELYVQGMAQQHPSTKFVSVRFGNVLGSNGSVVPAFKRQIAEGGPVTVTHPEMKRYFMTIPEAAQLVLEAAAMGRGGEVFILDMGEPVRIVDLARDLIRLSGFEPDQDIEIRFTGVRPGEKLFEELSTSEERAAKTEHAKIFVGRVRNADWGLLNQGIHELSAGTDRLDERQIYEALRRLIPEFSGRSAGETTLSS